ncbi:hypothetical protein SPONN_198 [uncultured Candidatus Thioglobus sp.]|nr:hypothetical protein SPONN_198 [uncultured Candidatus Thioglobus sp.]
MKLEYKILWLDDNIDAFIDDEHVKDIDKYISDQGFDTKIHTKSNNEEFFNTLDDTYDLILTDYHMDGLNGDEVVKKIRENSIFTEILFYTAKADLTDTQKLDRISFLETTTEHEEEVVKKAKELVDLTIKKFQDIIAMRGMVMSETSSLDVQKIEILESYIDSKSTNELKNLHDNIFSKIKLSVDEKCKKYKRLVDKDDGLKKLMKDRVLFSSSRKIEALSFILQELEMDDFSEKYKDEIINPRNQFAHAKFIEKNGDKFFEESEVRLDNEYFKQVRINILKHKVNLNNLENKLNE